MPVNLDKITASTAKIETVKDSVLNFINAIPGLIRDAITADDLVDATNVNALADRLETSAQAITDAIVANTPAEEEPPVELPVEPPVEP